MLVPPELRTSRLIELSTRHGHAMNVLIAPDSFKGSISSIDAAAAMAKAVRLAFADFSTVELPMSDGGEGTFDVLMSASGGCLIPPQVSGQMENSVEARFGVLSGGSTIVIEMATASDLTLEPPHLRNPRKTTTFGTGELILAALNEGVRTIIIGLGGSATNDCGAAMAEALGVRFLDAVGNPIARGGGRVLRN